jgi:oxygen-independent coproporphyrinogen-3 oxidase
VVALHLGCGTPSPRGGSPLREVLASLDTVFGFRPDAELAAEPDPCVLDDAVLRVPAEFGFHRTSLGVQDISPEVQGLIADAMRRLRAVGVASIKMGLIYGLPGQPAGSGPGRGSRPA